MLAEDLISRIMEYAVMFNLSNFDTQVRIHVGNQLYDVGHIDTVTDMDTNRQNIVIHVKDT